MSKVKEMSFADAQKELKASDVKLAKAAEAYAKAPKDEKTVAALREAALDFSRCERYARSAKLRETTTNLFG